MFLCALSLATGFVLDAVAKSDRRRWELAAYRAYPPSNESPQGAPWWATEFHHRDG